MTKVWRAFAKGMGNVIRFTTRAARDLDPAHQRDGAALLLVILALAAIAGTWMHSDSPVGNALYSFFYGGFGRIGFIAPLILLYFAFRLFRTPDQKRETARITIGTLALLISATGLAHLLNGSEGKGATAMREGGGWLGYAISNPLKLALTPLIAYPVLILVFSFGLLVVTATPFSQVAIRIKSTYIWLKSKAPKRQERDEEIYESEPFESPLVARFSNNNEDSDEEDDETEFEDEDYEEPAEDEFDEEFTVETPKAHPATAPAKRPMQMMLTPDSKYVLPPADILKSGPTTKGKSKANESVVSALTELFAEF